MGWHHYLRYLGQYLGQVTPTSRSPGHLTLIPFLGHLDTESRSMYSLLAGVTECTIVYNLYYLFCVDFYFTSESSKDNSSIFFTLNLSSNAIWMCCTAGVRTNGDSITCKKGSLSSMDSSQICCIYICCFILVKDVRNITYAEIRWTSWRCFVHGRSTRSLQYLLLKESLTRSMLYLHLE